MLVPGLTKKKRKIPPEKIVKGPAIGHIAVRALRNGAAGYLVDESVPYSAEEGLWAGPFNAKHIEVIRLMASGRTVSEAAKALGLSEAAVRSRLHRLGKSLGGPCRVEFYVMEALRRGLIT